MKTMLPRFLNVCILLLLTLSTFSQTTSTTTFNYTGSIATYTVPAGVTKLTITAKGARGGGSIMAGLGASMQGDFTVTPGQVLRILVGQEGSGFARSFSGGGGSFVADNATNSPLIVAGGGGGASCSYNGLPGNASQNGTSGNGASKTSLDGGGGINGGGGGGAASLEETNGFAGGGGAGFYGNGGRGLSISSGFLCSATTNNMFGGVGGNGGAGGDATTTSSCSRYYTSTANSFLSGGQGGTFGSFGGGGAAGYNSNTCSLAANGGGGGYSGGGAGNGSNPGGGGGSFNAGINQVNASGVNNGNGQVVIVAQLPTPATALKFDPSLTPDDNSRLNYVNVANPFRAFQKEITVEFWMYVPNARLPFGSIMGQGASNVDADWVWLMHPEDDGTMNFYVNDGGTFRSTNCTIRAGEWHHYAATASAASTKFYIDGVLVHTGPGVSGSILSNANSVIHIGKDVRYATRNIPNDDPWNRYATMTLDEVRIWSRALCIDEINANKNVEINPTGQNGLQQYYRFNQGFVNENNSTVTTLTDLSGNNRNGTLNNFILNGATSNWVASGSTNTGIVNAFVPPTAAIQGGTSICIGQSRTLTNTISGGSWTSSNTGVATINAATGQVTTVSAGTTTITYTTACGGVSTLNFTVNPLPTPAIAGTNTICSGSSTTLTASGGNTYSWNTGATTAAITVSPTVTTTYTVTATSAAGCTAQATRVVTVNAKPDVTASSNSPVQTGNNLQLSANGAFSYSWSGPNGFTSSSQNPVINNITSAGNGNYTVTGTNILGCTNTATINVTVLSTPATALKTDGVDDHVTISNPFRSFDKAITVEFWMNTPTGKLAQGSIMGQSSLNVDGMGTDVWLMHPDIGGTNLDFYVNDAGTWRRVTVPIRVGGWHHYVGVASEFGTKFYVDGVLEQTGPGISNGILSNANAIMQIGKDPRHTNFRFADMTIDEVRVWSRALCLEEITNNKNCELNPAGQNGLQEYYRFNQGFVGSNNATETSLTDLSGNNRHGTLSGFALTGNNSNWVESGFISTANCSPYIAPVSPITGNISLCIGSNTTLANATIGGLWSSSNTAVATINANTGVVNALSAGTTTITYRTECGGVSTATLTVNALPVATISGTNTICLGGSTVLTASGGATYLWNTGATTAAITVSPTVTTTYTVTVTSAAGCSAQASRAVTVNALPNAAVNGTNNICSGGSTILTATGGTSYLWNTGATSAAITVSPSATTTYTVTATNATGCTAQASRTVTVNANPVVTTNSNSPVALGNNLQLSANGAVNYSWSGPNGFTSSMQNPVINNVTTAANGTYTVTATNASGCANTATVNVTVLSDPATALHTDGVDDYVTINNPFRTFGKELTVEFWMNTPSAIMPYGSVMGQATAGVDNMSTNVWLMHPNTTGGIDFLVNDAGTWRGATVPIKAGGWHHYVGVSSEFGTKFYVDGVLEATGPAITTGIVNNANAVIHIGKDVRHNTGRFGNITVDEVRIWNRVLCEGEINNSMSCELNPSGLTGLQQYYRFNQGYIDANNNQETTLVDASGNGRDGQLNNFALTGANSNWVASGSVNTGTCTSYSPPTAPITGLTYICIGSTSTLSNSISGGLWSSSNPSVATIDANTGLVTSVSGGLTTITYKNECGGISTTTVTIAVLLAPTITPPIGGTNVCPGNTVTLNAPAGFGLTYQWYKDGIAISGATSRTYTATVSGTYTAARTSGSCSSPLSNAITVTIQDVTKPTITCSNNISVGNDPGKCGAMVSIIPPNATDNCSAVSITGVRNDGKDLSEEYPIGTTQITWTAKDASNNTNVCTQVVTVIDQQPPSITCQSNISAIATSAAGAVINYNTPIGTDNCAGATTVKTAGLVSGSTFPIGTTTVTYRVTDAVGLSTECSFTVTVAGVLPVITCPVNITVNAAAGTCAANVNFAATETAGIPASTISYTINGNPVASGASFPVGTTTVVAKATNAVGSTSCSFTVTVVDIQNPTITAPANVQGNNTAGLCTGTVTLGTPVTADNCGVATVDNDAPSTFPVGTTIVTWTVTDIHGNSATALQTIVIVDNEKPTISTSDLTVNNDPGKCAATVVISQPTTNDNCGVLTVMGVRSDNALLTADYPVGTTVITWTVRDVNGNIHSATQTVVVNDTELPKVKIRNIVVQLGANGQSLITASQINNGSTDNCAIASIELDKVNFNCSNVGDNTVLLTVIDIHGNSASANAIVTVQDNILPTVITQPVTVTLVNGSASITAAQVNNGSFDNCGIATMTVAPANFNCNNIGSNTVLLTITDVNGNTKTASAIVTVAGQSPSCSITSVPTSNVFTGGNPNNIYLGYGAQSTVFNVAATGGSSYTYQWSGTATQMLSSTNAAAPVFTPTAPGNYTFTVIVTNNFGCTSTCSITICVKDIRVPGTKGGAKVYICHVPPGNNNNPQTLEISVNAVSSHIGQHSGDRLGTCAMTACAEPVATAVTANKQAAAIITDLPAKAVSAEDLKVTVMPNPTSTYFTLKLESKYDQPVNMRVLNELGRVIDSRVKLGSNATIQVGHSYQSGTYFAEFTQGNRRKVVQLIKIR